ncbi:aminopeptidase P family protein [Pseudohalioglobus sediminis]|uniref:Aminopeptidase P family protein n=1 Tax=Pseudohalioglobus sediminis TaxID=2606449 RepID=A0A5B0X552_9GAMM|nr:aminopeptidase P family protein [Pseudohalioglobus sediminis]KAA1194446.1 aminopeptidase P family protein [Pseudohalioglobus sediminis]
MNTIAERLAAVRALMADAGYAALIVPRADEYLGEYIPAHNERLRWISGFTGSAGAVVVLPDRAAIFVDGRYTVQVRNEVSAELFEYHHLIQEPYARWLTQQLQDGDRVVCDPRMHSLSWFRETGSTLESAGLSLVPDTDNLVDRCWHDRPEPLVQPALLLGEAFSGSNSAAKRAQIAASISEQGADAALVFAPDSVSWLLDVRGTDIPCLPILQSFALLECNGDVTVFVDPGRIPPGFDRHVGEGVRLLPESAAEDTLRSYSGKRVLADAEAANAWTQLTLQAGGATLVAGTDPVLLPKACKNATEVEGARQAHRRDAAAEIRFLAWLDAEVDAGRLHDEAALSDQLARFREGGEHYQGPSFDTISAAGGNAAMCHYNHRNVPQPGQLTLGSVYLVDSGGQYLDGTTDITRTVAIGDPGEEVRRMFTLVLKGHIALDQARFPEGTTGTQLDALARQFLWQQGYDYDHGTGHGVGAFLSVHEGPQRIAKAGNAWALQPGMIVSNEPGYYKDDCYGIRCENLVVVRESAVEGDVPVYEFEALTLVPFDRRLLDTSLLTDAETAWLNGYHQRVLEEIGPLLPEADRHWLEQATRPL